MVNKQGFAALTAEQRAASASRGGKAAHASGRAHEFTSEEAKAAGRKGGAAVARRPGHMAEIGRKGGSVISKRAEHMKTIGKLGGRAKHRAER